MVHLSFLQFLPSTILSYFGCEFFSRVGLGPLQLTVLQPTLANVVKYTQWTFDPITENVKNVHWQWSTKQHLREYTISVYV